MFRIIDIDDGTEIGVSDSIFYIKVGQAGDFVPTDREHATGVAVDSTPYNLIGFDQIAGAPTVVVSEFDGGKTVQEQRKLIDGLILSALGV